MCYLKKKLTNIFVKQKFEDYPIKNTFVEQKFEDYPLKNIFLSKSFKEYFVEQKFEDVESWKRVSTQRRRVKESWQLSHRSEDSDQPT